MPKKAKIAMVGAGGMGQLAHLQNYVSINKCEVVALAEWRPRLREKMREFHNIPHVFPTVESMLESGLEIDAVVAAMHHANHINVVPQILQAKKHLLTEKPLAISIENGERLVKMAKDNGVLYAIGCQRNSDPAMEYAKKVITEMRESGEYGQMRIVKSIMPLGDWMYGFRRTNDFGMKYPWVGTDEVAPYAELEQPPSCFTEDEYRVYNHYIGFLCHQFSAVRYLLGENYRVVYADNRETVIIGKSESGIPCSIERNTFTNTTAWMEELFVGFDKAFIKLEMPPPFSLNKAGVVTVMRDNGKEPPTLTTPIMPNVHSFYMQAVNFVLAVLGERDLACPAESNLEDLKVSKQCIDMMKLDK